MTAGMPGAGVMTATAIAPTGPACREKPKSAVREGMRWQRGGTLPSRFLGLAAIALLIRLVFLLAYEQYPPFLADDRGYDQVAVNLMAGKGFVAPVASMDGNVVNEPVVAFGPVYPAFLAFIYALFGHSVEAVRLSQAVLGAATVLVVYCIAVEAFDERVALLAGFVTAIHPALVIYAGMLVTETLFAFLLTLSVWAMIVAVSTQSLIAWLRAGCIVGLAVLLREEAVAVAALFVATIFWYGDAPHKTRQVLIFTAALVLTVGGWTIRNYHAFGEVIPVSANGGKTLWISTVGWQEWRYDDEPYRSLVRGLNDVERDRVLRREGIKNILADPLRYLGLCAQRLGQFWLGSHTTYLAGFSGSFQTYYSQGAFGKVVAKGLLLCFNIGLLALAMWGIWTWLIQYPRYRDLRLICLQPVIAIAAAHFFLFATSRYQVPILPCLLIFSAAGASRAWNHLHSDVRLAVPE